MKNADMLLRKSKITHAIRRKDSMGQLVTDVIGNKEHETKGKGGVGPNEMEKRRRDKNEGFSRMR